MAKLGFEVHTEQLPEAQDFSPLPPNNYTVMIVKSEVIPTNKTKKAMGDSGVSDLDHYRKANPSAEIMLRIEMDVQDEGQYKNRKIFHHFNLVNESAQAVSISQGQMRQLAKDALKILNFSDSEELHDKRFVVEVDIQQGKDYVKDGVTKKGFASNVVKKFLPVGSASSAASTSTSATSRGPWDKK